MTTSCRSVPFGLHVMGLPAPPGTGGFSALCQRNSLLVLPLSCTHAPGCHHLPCALLPSCARSAPTVDGLGHPVLYLRSSSFSRAHKFRCPLGSPPDPTVFRFAKPGTTAALPLTSGHLELHTPVSPGAFRSLTPSSPYTASPLLLTPQLEPLKGTAGAPASDTQTGQSFQNTVPGGRLSNVWTAQHFLLYGQACLYVFSL